MQPAFAILGLQPGASLVEIKKAYARLLKQTRPDDDAAGFQRLQEAYEACIAFTKYQQARAEERERRRALAPAGADQDDNQDDDEEPGDDSEEFGPAEALPAPVPVRSRIVPMAPPPPLRSPTPMPNAESAPPRAAVLAEPELRRLLEQIIAQGESLSGFKLRQWLHAHDELVSLDVQRLVALALPAFILETKPSLDTEKLRVLFEYFIGAEYNPAHADPRLRMAWEQVQAEEIFQRELAALRRRHHTRIDKLLFDELLAAPKAWRRRLLLSVPTMVGRIGGLLAAIHGIDPERAERELQPEAAKFWGALAAPGRLPARLVALVHAQLLLGIAIIVGAIGSMQGMDALGIVGMVLAGTIEASVVWFVLKGLAIARYHLAMRRARKLAAGQKVRDTLLTFNYALCAVAGALSFMQLFYGSETGVVGLVACCAGLIVLILFMSGRGRRWEMLLLAGVASSAIGRILAVLLGAWMPGPGIDAFSLALGALIAVLADEWHARREKIEPARARFEVNHIALKLVAACVVVLFLGLNFGVAKGDTSTNALMTQGTQLSQPDSDSKAHMAAVQARIQQAVDKLRQEGQQKRPIEQMTLGEQLSQGWQAGQDASKPPKFQNVDEAFQAVLHVVTPNEVSDSGYRAFHVTEGPFAGDWIFSGGNHSRPDRMVHYPLANATGERKAGQMLCRKNNDACRAFKAEAATVPAELARDDRQSWGARLTWDSPGLPAASFECPPAELQPFEHSPRPSLDVRVLFDGRGNVLDIQSRGGTGDAGVDSAVYTAALHCKIVATNSEPGIIETKIEIPRQ